MVYPAYPITDHPLFFRVVKRRQLCPLSFRVVIRGEGIALGASRTVRTGFQAIRSGRFWLFFLLFFVSACWISACGGKWETPGVEWGEKTLVVFHAGSLAWPVKALGEAFRERYPDVSIQAEASGSREAIRKITELGREADVLISADARLIDEMMIPQFADWNILFARNEMVVAYTPRSRFADQIGPENWYRILLEQGITCGSSDPKTDPLGYRARMVWQLAEGHYGTPGLAAALNERCAQENIRPRSMELVFLLQSNNLDYAFLYRSVAQQYSLQFIPLPPEINLCCPEYAAHYQQATVKLQEPDGTTVIVGEPIVYGVTIPRNAPHPDLAVEFVKFLLEPQARSILEKMGQPAIVPPEVHGRETLPASLRVLFP